MKTILHTIDTTGPGGAETVFIELATKLGSELFQSVVVIRGKGWVYDQLCKRGIQPILLDAKGSFNLSYLKGLCRIIKEHKVDVIQSHLLGAGVYASMAGKITHTPVIATFHGEVDIGEDERFKNLKFLALRSGAKYVVAVTDSLKEDIVARSILRSADVRVIYNGIDLAAFKTERHHRLREKYGWSSNDKLIGCLGNIRVAKGYDILMQVAKLLESEKAKFRFVIAGDAKKSDTLFQSLLELRQKLGLDEVVKFYGFTEDPADFLAGIDIFLSSSISEGLPLSAIQAMATGVPVIATRCGGYRKLIDNGVNGVLVEVGEPEAIAQGLRELTTSPELCKTLSANAQKMVAEKYDKMEMLKQYQALYESCT